MVAYPAFLDKAIENKDFEMVRCLVHFKADSKVPTQFASHSHTITETKQVLLRQSSLPLSIVSHLLVSLLSLFAHPC